LTRYAGEDEIIAFLIHGTFAQGAAWTQPNSMLCNALQCAVAHQGKRLITETVNWGGSNSLQARRIGARSLLRAFTNHHRRKPNATYVAIGHSHGGSVIAYARLDTDAEAIRDESIDNAAFVEKCGAVFLSTPFIDLKARDGLENIVTIPIAFIGYIVFFFSLHSQVWEIVRDIIFRYCGDALDLSVQDQMLEGLTATVICLAIITVGLVARSLLARYAKHRCQEFELSFATTGIQKDGRHSQDHLFIRCVGDEASATLSAGQFANWAFGQVLNVFTRLAFWADSTRILLSWIRHCSRLLTQARVAWPIVLLPLIFAATSFGIFFLVALIGNYIPKSVLNYFYYVDYIIGPAEVNSFLAATLDIFSRLEDVAASYPWQWKKLWGLVMSAIFFGAIVGMWASLLLYGLCLVLLLVMSIMLALVFAALGRVAIVRNLLLDIAIEPLPLGEVLLKQVNWDGLRTRGLYHSATYDHPEVHEYIAKWILQRGERPHPSK
jgi:hypothetical protein